MNKIAFISDIHGNFPALSAVLNDINQQGIDQIFCLGDLVGYYCCINEVIDEIRKNCIESCLGNHDFALINNGGIIQRSKTCTTTLTKQLGYISKDNINYLKKMSSKLTISYNDKKIICIHGGLNNHID